jgi:hypothetical protein
VAGVSVTDYTGPSGTLFHIYSNSEVPEPSAAWLIASGLLFASAWTAKRGYKRAPSSAHARLK